MRTPAGPPAQRLGGPGSRGAFGRAGYQATGSFPASTQAEKTSSARAG